MHPNLVVFKDRAAADKWVKDARWLLARAAAVAVVVDNPTAAVPNGCSVYFVPVVE